MSATAEGVRGRRVRAAMVERARGREGCREGRRQGAVLVKMFGDMVSAIA